MADPWETHEPTGALILADGSVLYGRGFGAEGVANGEVCFNTAISGYQEILTDPSYCDQIITFTFPHIGNVGVNENDTETINAAASSGVKGAIVRAPVTNPSNYRSAQHFDLWMKSRSIIGLAEIDTRALTNLIRESGMANALIAHAPDGHFDIPSLKQQAAAWPGIDGSDLVPTVTTRQRVEWTTGSWDWDTGPDGLGGFETLGAPSLPYHVVALDFGVKRNILRLLTDQGCRVTLVPATTSAEDILALNPDGIFLSNGPGDPAATGEYAVPTIRALVESGIPVFGICLGHQILGLALGGQTLKMHQGHHGANHPVMDHTTGKVEIVSMNHGFAVDPATLSDDIEQTHVSLFDGTNCGLQVKGRPVFSVQHHPEASPGPMDSHYLFERFVDMIKDNQKAA